MRSIVFCVEGNFGFLTQVKVKPFGFRKKSPHLRVVFFVKNLYMRKSFICDCLETINDRRRMTHEIKKSHDYAKRRKNKKTKKLPTL
jgi:hypothetical protein